MPGLQIKPLAAVGAAFSRLQASLYQPPSNRITGISPTAWPNPLQPVMPIGPAGSQPLGWEFYEGQNLNYTPRPDAVYAAADLQFMALYPLARICIENVKDQICQLPWNIQLRPIDGESQKDREAKQKEDPIITQLMKFFERPDGENDWSDWLRPIIEDMMVIDAASILVYKTRAGKIAEMRWTPGASITRLIDDRGFTPKAPDPAYQQNWQGIPRVDLNTDQLIYKVRNIVPRGQNMASYLYGMSPVEALADELKIGIERLKFVLAYYSAGSIPGAIQIVRAGVSPDKIKEAMQWMNSTLAGDLAKRRQWQFIQGFNDDGKPEQVLFPKEPLLADNYDELHIRKVAFGLNTSAQRLQRALNRASAQAGQEAAEEEGTAPVMNWVLRVMNYIIQVKFGYDAYEMAMNPDRETDILKRAQADTAEVAKIRTINEIRDDRGLDPRPEKEADMLGEFTPQGFVPIDVRPPVPAAPGAGPVAVPRGAPAPTSSTAPAGAPPKKKVLAMRY